MPFLRFVIPARDWRTGQATGLLTLAYEQLRSGELTEWEHAQLGEHLRWLELNLPVPDRFARKRNVSHKNTHGVSWLKAEATPAVDRMRAVATLLWERGHSVEMVMADRPGYIVYEDLQQIVAEPFHGEPA
ncbi:MULTISPECIES: hypothetical protein [unclassified Lysobacter]|uniref:hypothetical protein n=1 Tax=unclassified Lysobacter TaxID=2635362 RepID=UPI0006FF6EBD|nr:MULTISPECIES: hypothetical protein [unclassified Lysobacter]KRA16432.1 hypothetical protein ASD69_17185 [Lysobacter sp. Root604]KRD76003.1 hypothetical protein ASE43_14425 [Lysobacter sp. Root983]